MGTGLAGFLIVVGVIFFIIGGIALFGGGSMIGSVFFGVFGLVFVWLGGREAQKTKERYQRIREYLNDNRD